MALSLASTLDEALRGSGIELRAKRYNVWLRAKCPFAGCADKRQKRMNLAVRLEQDSIGYKCHRCGESGRLQLSDKPRASGLSKRSRTGASCAADWRPNYNGPAR